MEGIFSVSIWHRGPVSHVICGGELDISTCPELQDAIDMVLETEPTRVSIDGRRLSLLTSSGVEVLRTTAQRCRQRGIDLELKLSERGWRIVDLLGRAWVMASEEDFSMPSDVEEALRSQRDLA